MKETKDSKQKRFSSRLLQTWMILVLAGLDLSCQAVSKDQDSFDTLVALISGNTQTINSNPGKENDSSPSGESPNRPILNDLTVQTTYLTGSADQQRIEVKFSFQQNPPSPLSIRAYLGRPNIIALNPDGMSVKNYIQQNLSPDSFFLDRFIFLSPETSQPYKIIVIASNSFGKSSKEIISSPPTPPAGPCNGAVSAPTTIGNCADHCVQVTMNGNFMELTAKDTTTSIQDYFYLDLTTSTPTGGSGPTPFAYLELGLEEPPVPVSIGSHSTTMQTFDTQTYNDACIVVSSYRVLDGVGGFSDNYIFKKIIVP